MLIVEQLTASSESYLYFQGKLNSIIIKRSGYQSCFLMHRDWETAIQDTIVLLNVLFNVQICFWVESVFIEFVELIFQSVDYQSEQFYLSSFVKEM